MRPLTQAFILVILATQSAWAAPITGVYSSLTYSTRSGDLNGMEIVIRQTFDGLYAVIACGPGAPIPLKISEEDGTYKLVLAERHEDALCGYEKTWVLEPTESSLLIRQEGKEKGSVTSLPRRPSYWNDRDRTS